MGYQPRVFNKQNKIRNNNFAPKNTFNKKTFFDEYYDKLNLKQRGPMERKKGSNIGDTNEFVKKPNMKKQHSF